MEKRIYKIDALTQEEMKGVSWQNVAKCPRFEDLRLLKLPYKRLDGTRNEGEMVVHCSVAEEVLAIFFELMESNFRIHSVERIEKYGGSDEKSMAANNSSGFNFRTIEGSARLSSHAMGLAIDINPKWNPWVRGGHVSPENGKPFVDRSIAHPGLIREEGPAVEAFRKRGWDWGGLWQASKDFHHFQKS